MDKVVITDVAEKRLIQESVFAYLKSVQKSKGLNKALELRPFVKKFANDNNGGNINAQKDIPLKFDKSDKANLIDFVNFIETTKDHEVISIKDEHIEDWPSLRKKLLGAG